MFSFLFYIILLSLNFTEHYCQRVSVSLRVQKAQDIRRYMNLSVDPCDDFYEYACGNFRTEFPLENDNMYPFSTLQQVEDKVDKELLSLVIQPRQTHDDVCHQQMKDFHKSCMSLDQINRVGIEPIKTTINDLGGMPLLNHYWDEREFNWIDTITNLTLQYNVDILVTISNHYNDVKKKNEHYLDPPSYQPMYKLFNTKSEALEEIIGLLQRFSNKNDDIRKVAEEIYNMEYGLYKNIHQVEPDYEELNLQRNAYNKHQDLVTFIYKFPSMKSTPTKISTNGYFDNLEQIMSSKPKKSIANYIMWNFIRHMNMTSDQGPNIKRSKFCLGLSKQYFSDTLGELYNQYKESISKELRDDITELKIHLKNDRQNVDIDLIRTDSKPRCNLNKNTIQTDQFLQNLLKLMNKQAEKVQNKVNTDPVFVSYSIFPFQIDKSTKIQIPKGMFNYPLYNVEFPRAIKFGQIGALVSREIVKPQIVKKYTSFYINENYKNKNKNHIPNSYDKIKCFYDQYKNYKFGDGYLPENSHQEENIADCSAIRVAFEAYLNWLEGENIGSEKLKTETLKKLDFTNTQLFFISYAQTYCSNLMETGDTILPDKKDFIPEKIRVNAALSNYDEFSTEFNCPSGSIMNIFDKCTFDV